MKIVGSGFGNRVNDRAGSSTVFSCIAGRDDRKFLNTVHTQIEPSRASRRGIGIIVDDDSIHAVAVFIGAVAGIRQLVAKAAVPFVGAEPRSHLARDFAHARLQRGQ